MWSLIGGIWGKIATLVAGIAMVLGTALGWRHSIRKSVRQEIATKQAEATIKRLEIKSEVERNFGNASGDVRSRLRDKGLLRD